MSDIVSGSYYNANELPCLSELEDIVCSECLSSSLKQLKLCAHFNAKNLSNRKRVTAVTAAFQGVALGSSLLKLASLSNQRDVPPSFQCWVNYSSCHSAVWSLLMFPWDSRVAQSTSSSAARSSAVAATAPSIQPSATASRRPVHPSTSHAATVSRETNKPAKSKAPRCPHGKAGKHHHTNSIPPATPASKLPKDRCPHGVYRKNTAQNATATVTQRKRAFSAVLTGL
ncbi:hypothetical protein R3P38DRAFT_2764696 [Favolaschia claudopus]|uniref:Uncharacterized protein n=1 Tax=Favolaschia claudopus TaxID=2862362 RepID=A0AAW0DBP4_9AGAR